MRTRYGLDLIGISLNSISLGGEAPKAEPKDRRKVSLLGGEVEVYLGCTEGICTSIAKWLYILYTGIYYIYTVN